MTAGALHGVSVLLTSVEAVCARSQRGVPIGQHLG